MDMEKEPSLEQEETDAVADSEASEDKKTTIMERVETAWKSLRMSDNRPLFFNALFFACSFFFMECVLKVDVYGTLFDLGLR